MPAFGFNKKDTADPLPALTESPPEPSTVIQALQALIDGGKPFSAEIVVAGGMQKITIKEANPCEKTIP